MRTILLTAMCLCTVCFAAAFADPVNVGTQRELFLDDFWIESSKNVQLLVHHPERREVATEWDKPWEGNCCTYVTVFKDTDAEGALFRMYYTAWSYLNSNSHPAVIAYQESRDGIRWNRPELDLFDFRGSKKNNIVCDKIDNKEMHDFNPFLDLNPDTVPEAKYKAVGQVGGGHLPLWAFQSSDGIHWKVMKNEPVSKLGNFDTQNVVFWSVAEKKYVFYYRKYEKINDQGGNVRVVYRAVSDDFLNWTDEGRIRFPKGEGPRSGAEFYTNQIKPYYRAPHLYIGFPERYCREESISRSTELLPEKELRWERMGLGKQKGDTHQRYGTAITDSVYISSRDGLNFRQSNDVFLSPGLRTKDNWSYGDNLIAWHVVETESTEADSPPELSLYAIESKWTGDSSRLRRFTLRIDGFASLHAKTEDGEVVTKPLIFAGRRLSINMGTSAAGEIRVELLDGDNKPISGFTAADCDAIFGDSLDRTVSWKGNEDLSPLVGKSVKLRFVMREADVYSFIFCGSY